jgi:hypothetical protein
VPAVTETLERLTGDDTASSRSTASASLLGKALATGGLAAGLVATAFTTGGGVDQNFAVAGETWTEIALAVVGAVALSVGVLRRAHGDRRSGWIAAGLMSALFADSAASIAWSWAPDSSWIGASQMFGYLMIFAGAIALARPFARGWPTVLGALVLWSCALCGWSLLVKVFPASLAPSTQFGRLQAPFGYWNAIALCAGMGVPCCLWLGTRRDGGQRLAVLAAPALTLLISVLVLSYSRSADFAAAIAVGLWLLAVPLRLRALAVLALGGLGALVVSAWALTHHGVSGNGVAIAAQDHAGHVLGVVIVLVLLLVTIAGAVMSEALERVALAPDTRRRIGAGLVAMLAFGFVGAILALATSSRGLGGQISYRWHELVNPTATVSAGAASRVFQVGSTRPLYWHEALFVGKLAYWKGVGELGYSVARLLDPLSFSTVFQAHSYVFQTFADLGTLGLVLSAALLLAWLAASGRSVSLVRGRASAGGEQVALVTLVVLVIAFGIQGALDWTWFFAGLSAPALLAAGWVAGRGPADVAQGPAPSALEEPGRILAVAALAVAVVLGGWMIWRPLHSAQLVNSAESSGRLAVARAAQSADPLSLQTYETLSEFDVSLHQPNAAVAELQQGVHEQPHNPQSWEQLAALDQQLHRWTAMLAAAQQARARVVAPSPLQYIATDQTVIATQHLQAEAVPAPRRARRSSPPS